MCGYHLYCPACLWLQACHICDKCVRVLQAEDRAHRVGQKGTVLVRYLIAPGTCDDIMWPLLSKKLQVVGQVIDGGGVGNGEYCEL